MLLPGHATARWTFRRPRDPYLSTNRSTIIFNLTTTIMSAPTPEAKLGTYNGNCHCGAVTFTVRIPSLTEQTVTNCNCSICVRNGYHWVFPQREDIVFHTGVDNLSEFRFASKVGVHRFCKTCGSSVSADFGEIGLGINVSNYLKVLCQAIFADKIWDLLGSIVPGHRHRCTQVERH